eukprot:500892-Amorphochlora_amoeboformis.AAC.1
MPTDRNDNLDFIKDAQQQGLWEIHAVAPKLIRIGHSLEISAQLIQGHALVVLVSKRSGC